HAEHPGVVRSRIVRRDADKHPVGGARSQIEAALLRRAMTRRDGAAAAREDAILDDVEGARREMADATEVHRSPDALAAPGHGEAVARVPHPSLDAPGPDGAAPTQAPAKGDVAVLRLQVQAVDPAPPGDVDAGAAHDHARRDGDTVVDGAV